MKEVIDLNKNLPEKQKMDKDDTVKTNMGEMPKNDYYDIAAMQYGFDDYEDLKRHGYTLEE